MRLFIAREALDRHLSVAGDLVNPKAPLSRKVAALPKIAAFYAAWYPSRWLGWGRWPRFAAFGTLAPHVRFLDRTARKLARTIFHLMVVNGPKLEKRQALLFRAVDVGADLFAMSAAVARAEGMRKAGDPDAAKAGEMADLFCRSARRRIASRFRAIRANDDVAKYAAARKLLEGGYSFLEKGLVDETAVLKVPSAPEPARAEELVPAR
jgi:hypothetical protein